MFIKQKQSRIAKLKEQFKYIAKAKQESENTFSGYDQFSNLNPKEVNK